MILLLSTVIVFWNVENFFDYKVKSSISEYDWNASRFYSKARNVGKVILSLSDSAGNPPSLVGLAEIDSKRTLNAIIHSPVLEAYGYRFVHYDSPDKRGIDCALLYRGDAPLCSRPIPLTMDGKPVQSRDLLLVEFDSLAVLVCHLPSKRGGSTSAMRLRQRAMEMIDSVAFASTLPMVVVGDFNDEGPSDWEHLRELSSTGSEGSIKFQGRWEAIDRCLVSDSLNASMHTAALDFLLTEDKAYGGVKPHRTHSGPRYIGGLSDHLPIVITLTDP